MLNTILERNLMTDAEKQNYDALFINIFERLEKLEEGYDFSSVVTTTEVQNSGGVQYCECEEDGTVVKTVSKRSLGN
ncbi:TPA: hypothetical protein VJZ89_001610 [Streptococcus pyogenes]|uniref:Uncharacterized protein n=3 Tax=Streptococcus pyogenes TaxID=1314 RepID=A0A5S4TLC4_STRPY|nr:hypothetical protein SpyM3_1453 [Streptococcus phage 315.6]AAM80060.1 hypothetical protein - phage-associated [Streptococcus pyogenes MGAS315]AIG46718.1 hypothetical protein STAB902_02355 [Streptococcus pyogenes STAB902]AYO92315.1 hypothetical protein DMC40_02770 [Streptococcus pyogenes]WDT95167.1 hypothetical protein C9Q_07335 [Streptococcus pyogenes MGAS10870]BAC63508.1 hypothetical protein [Streptococcus pyogenes SSI-1]HEP6168603.1 hypothetical protein [Streptococcus pyogenes ABC0200479